MGVGAGEHPPFAPGGPEDTVRGSLGLPLGGAGWGTALLNHEGPIYPSIHRSISTISSPLKPVFPSCFL